MPVDSQSLTISESERRRNALMAGFFAGFVSIFGTFWLDVKKVQRQVKGENFSLWKGMSPALCSQAMRTGITYCGFDSLSHKLKDAGYKGIFWDFIAAASGAVFGELFCTPVDVIKNSSIKNQDVPTRKIPAFIVERNGPIGFFSGLGPAMLRKSISNGGLLSLGPHSVRATYNGLCGVWPDYSRHVALITASKLIGGGVAGGCMEVLTLPIDKVKVYSQAVVNPSTGKNHTIPAAVVAVWRQGIPAMFAGATAAFTRKGLIKAVQYFVLMETVDILKRRSLRKAALEAARQQEERQRSFVVIKP